MPKSPLQRGSSARPAACAKCESKPSSSGKRFCTSATSSPSSSGVSPISDRPGEIRNQRCRSNRCADLRRGRFCQVDFALWEEEQLQVPPLATLGRNDKSIEGEEKTGTRTLRSALLLLSVVISFCGTTEVVPQNEASYALASEGVAVPSFSASISWAWAKNSSFEILPASTSASRAF